MDFIERWLHISPDGGSGLVEVLWIAAIILAALALALRRSLYNILLRYLRQLGSRVSDGRRDA